MSVESKPNKLVKGLVLDTFHTDVDNTVATYALNSQLEDQEGNHFHYGSEVGTTYIKEIPTNHVVIGHINMERNETVLFTTDGTNSTIGILSRNDDMSYNYEIKVDDTKQAKKLNFKKDTYIRGVYRLLNGCDKVIYFVDGINKDRRININKLDSYKTSDTASIASGIIFDDSLRATIYSLSSATGNIQLIRLMSANAEATANALANLSSGESITKLLDASANGIGTAFANLMRTANLISSTNATGTTTSNVDIIRLLQGNVTAIGSVNATLESITQGLVEIEVSLTGVASTTAALLRVALLESTLTTEASTVVDAILTRVINAQVQASANTSSSAQITIPVNASATATAVTAADALLSYAVNATVNAMANTSATAQLSKVITASADALASSSAEALIGLVLISTTSATGSVSSANLFISRLLASSVTAQGTTTAQLLIAELLSSTVTSQATTTGNILLSKLMSSNATSNATSVASLLISDLLNSSVNGIATSTTNLTIADLLSSTITGTATTQALLEAITAIVSDPYIDNVSLLLQGDNNPTGVTQNNTFIDSSTNNFTITRNGNVTQGTFSPFDKAITNSGGSAYFDGAGDYLQIPNNSNLTLGTGNFTIEFWIYPLSQPGNFNSIIGGNATSEPIVNLRGSGTSSSISMNIFGTADIFNINFTFTQNNWYHVAISRSGTSLKVYVNGNQIGSTITDSTNISAPITSVGGLFNQYVQNFNGYISNLRVVKGTAVYTANFQPSTTPLTAITNTSLLLNFNNAAIFDGVKNNNIETVGIASITTTPSLTKFGNGAIAINGSSSSSDYITVPSNTIHNLGSDSFTIEFWLYVVSNPTTSAGLITRASHSSNTGYTIMYYPTGYVALLIGTNTLVQTPVSSISTLTWTHIAFVRSGTSGRFFINGTQSGNAQTINNFTDASTPLAIGALNTATGWNANLTLTGVMDDFRITKGIARYTSNFTVPSKLPSLIPNYLINRSLRFSAARQTYLSRTPTVVGNRRTWTWSGWVKRGQLGTTNIILSADVGSTEDTLLFSTNNTLFLYPSSNNNYGYITTNVFRDVSAWYHIVLSVNTTLATGTDRVKIYVNGIQQSLTPSPAVVIQDYDWGVNNTVQQLIGLVANGATYFDGYMAEVNFIDGQALTPTSFGELDVNTGVWIPKAYSGTYGTNGFRLKFSDLTQLGEDFSGNLNNWTPTNFTTTPGANYDLINDTPINADDTIGNYATLNPLRGVTSLGVFSNGNLQVNGVQGSINCIGTGTIAFVGKMYCEITIVTAGNDTTGVGIGLIPITSNQTNIISGMTTGIYYLINGNKRITGVNSSYGLSYTSGDIIGITVDTNAETVTFYKNNSSQGEILGTGIISTGVLLYIGFQDSGNPVISSNFGQRPFVYTPPTGFKALNTYNLPTPTIGATAATQANKFMDISLYTGTGAAQSIFNSGAFQPDLVWIKNRTGTASNHALYDSVRGVTKQLSSNLDALETTEATGLTAFNSNGFTIGALGQINTSGSNYIAWQWKASNTTVANNVGIIPSTVSVNTTAGFSIVSYTGNGNAGATIGHGLNNIPKLIIIKVRTGVAANWIVYHDSFGLSFGNIPALFLNNSSTEVGSITYWNNTRPTNNLITLGTDSGVNANTRNYIAYVWAEIDGFSKFNSYVGNGSTDGTFVYTGFRPKFILIRKYNSSGDWVLYNSIVNTSNPVSNELLANSTLNENTTDNDLDFLSNGFKLRSANANINTSSTTYIYGAFAEFPLKYANAALTERVKETIQVDYLVVAGGGGGGGYDGGGGGAGGYRTSAGTSGGGASAESKLILTKGTTYTITVGGGGAAATNGSNSVLHNITSTGGGQGGTGNSGGSTGGSGGGGGVTFGGIGVAQTGGTATTSPLQGYPGGNSVTSGGNPPRNCGGGGGAGGAGANGTISPNNAGNGGAGVASSISGITPNPTYAGGGGGATQTGTIGSGQNGGGNGGKNDTSVAPTSGSINTGGGGGGGYDGGGGGAGGSGVVIIKYPNTEPDLTLSVGIQYATSNGTVTTSITTAGQYAPSYTPTGFKVYEFRGTGGVPLNITW
jgi:hypothetical protein